MTEPPADRSQADFVTDAEIARRWGVSGDTARIAIRAFERMNRTFPPKDPLFANKRYWPAVKAFMDARYGVRLGAPPTAVDGPEHLNEKPPRYSRRPRPHVAAAR